MNAERTNKFKCKCFPFIDGSRLLARVVCILLLNNEQGMRSVASVRSQCLFSRNSKNSFTQCEKKGTKGPEILQTNYFCMFSH